MFSNILEPFGGGSAEPYEPIVSGIENLGHRLQRSMTASSVGENFVVSPASVGLALLLLRFGARGRTRENLNQGLGLASYETESDLAEGARHLMATLRAAPKERLIAVASSLWANAGNLEFYPEYVEVCRRALQAEVRSLDLNRIEGIEEINQWVGEHTLDLIKNLLDSSCVEAAAILVNALVFKGSWKTPFSQASTRPRPFLLENGTSKDVPTMAGELEVKLWQEGDRQWVVMPFCGKAEMRILLPAPGESLEAATADLAGSAAKAPEAMFEGRVKLELPRFKVDFKGDLLAVLDKLGFIVGPADLSGLAAGPLIISKVIHQAKVEVDEDGALGVAATAIVLTRGAPPPRAAREIKVDRPFYFQLREKISDLVLFSGLIYDPAGS